MSDKATLRRLLRELNDAVFVEDHEKLEEQIVNLFDAVREERDREIDLLKSTIQDNEAYFMQLRAELEAEKERSSRLLVERNHYQELYIKENIVRSRMLDALTEIVTLEPEYENDTLQAVRHIGKMVAIARAARTGE